MSVNFVPSNAHQGEVSPSSKTTTIDNIPNEILEHIFESYVAMGRSPWDLTLISRLWRSAALADPNLWTNIWITSCSDRFYYKEYIFTEWTIRGHPRTIFTAGKWQLCQDNEDLLKCLDRTGSAVLNIMLNSRRNIKSPLQVLLRPPFSSRIERLGFHFNRMPPMTSLEDNLGPFTSLKYLGILSKTDTSFINRLIESVQATAFKLTELSLGNWLNTYEKLDFMSPLLHRVQYLEMTSARITDLVLPHCPKLIGLRSNDLFWPEKSLIDTDVSAKVQSLTLSVLSERLHFHLLSLQVLTITTNWRYGRECYNRTSHDNFTLPNLISLRFHCNYLIWLTHLHAPVLSELEIIVQVDLCDCQDKYKLMEDTSFHPPCLLKPSLWSRFSNISKLTLGAHCREEYFNTVIDSIPNIQSLHLIPIRTFRHPQNYALPILDHLVNISVAGSLSQLKAFKFGSQKHPLYTSKDDIDLRVNSIIESRMTKGMEMLCFDVYWKSEHYGRSETQLERYLEPRKFLI